MIKIIKAIAKPHCFKEFKKGTTLYYIEIDNYVEEILCSDYLNCDLQEYHKFAIEYNTTLIHDNFVPVFLNLEDIQKFLDDWIYPRLIMNKLVNNIC